MSYARPLTGIEVKKAVAKAIERLETTMGLTNAGLAEEASLWLEGFSSLEGEHLVYPHVAWDLEGTIEKAKIGGSGTWASITMDLNLGEGILISRRFGSAAGDNPPTAPKGVDTQIFVSQQQSVRTPDTLRERWLAQAEPAQAQAPEAAEPQLPPGPSWVPEAPAPAPEAQLLDPVGELPNLPLAPEAALSPPTRGRKPKTRA